MMWTLENCFVQEVSKGLSTSNFIEFFFKKKIHFEFSSNLNFMCIFTTATASVLTDFCFSFKVLRYCIMLITNAPMKSKYKSSHHCVLQVTMIWLSLSAHRTLETMSYCQTRHAGSIQRK